MICISICRPPILIDEVQRISDLFEPLKWHVMKLASEPLAGRAAMMNEMMNGSFRDHFLPTMSWHCQHGASEYAKYPQDFPTGIF